LAELPTPPPENAEYERLREVARGIISCESRDCTLTATGLVHELYLRVAKGTAPRDPDDPSPIPYASRVMRQILIDRARSRQTRRKSERFRQETAEAYAAESCEQNDRVERLLQLEEVLQGMAEEMPDSAELVRLRLYLDLSIEASAQELGISRATAYRKWAFAKVWLAQRLDWSF